MGGILGDSSATTSVYRRREARFYACVEEDLTQIGPVFRQYLEKHKTSATLY